MPITQDEVRWAYRTILDREAETEILEPFSRHFSSTSDIRQHLMNSAEYALKNGAGAGRTRMGDATVLALLDPYGVKGRLYVNLSDMIGLSIARGEYEREEIAFMRKNLHPRQTLLDIGGNIGLFAIVGSLTVGTGGKVFTIEALKRNADVIKANVEENYFCQHNVTIIHAIAGDTARSDMLIAYSPLEEGSGNSGGSYIVQASSAAPKGLHTEPVRQEPLDNLIDPSVKIDFIKIDVEGAEALAMAGASRILKKNSPVILSEVYPSQLLKISGRTWQQYFKQMAEFGYRPHFFAAGEITGKAANLDEEKIYNVAFIKGD